MTLREVLTWPHPLLAQRATEVTVFDEGLVTLLADMVETMTTMRGVGLAAPQVGDLRRVVVMDVFDGVLPSFFINPRLSEHEGEAKDEEGCLSVPGETGLVRRAAKVRVDYQGPSGVSFSMIAEGLAARCIQHEVDHLDGVVFVKHLSKLRRDVIRKKMMKLK